MSKKKKSKRRIGRANPLLYAVVHAFLRRKYTKKYNISFDRDAAKKIKGPAIVLATHTSDADHILSALTLYPIRPTYIVSQHFMHNKSTARLLKLMHVITKKMFTPDVSTIINIMRAKEEGSVIVIFPEGRLSCYGHTLPVTAGTAELIKKLGIDVYSWKAEGAYLTFPKWRNKGEDRIGKIHASLKPLMTADEVKNMSLEKIRALTDEAILHDDELAMQGTEYKCDAMARGVDKILFKCPKCMKEGTVAAEGNKITCECGLDVTLDGFYRLHGSPFERINEWFEWQQESIDTERERLVSRVRLGCPGPDGFMDPYAGFGEASIDKDSFTLSGTLHGEKIEFSVPSERVCAFPITPGEHFDIYHGGRLIYVYPEPDNRASVKWVCFLDKLMKETIKIEC